MSNTPVDYALDNTLGIIRVDNPPVNALSQPVREGIIRALEQARTDHSELLLLLCAAWPRGCPPAPRISTRPI